MTNDLRARYDALMRRQIPGTDDGGVSVAEYHEANRDMYALLKDALAEVERLRRREQEWDGWDELNERRDGKMRQLEAEVERLRAAWMRLNGAARKVVSSRNTPYFERSVDLLAKGLGEPSPLDSSKSN